MFTFLIGLIAGTVAASRCEFVRDATNNLLSSIKRLIVNLTAKLHTSTNGETKNEDNSQD